MQYLTEVVDNDEAEEPNLEPKNLKDKREHKPVWAHGDAHFLGMAACELELDAMVIDVGFNTKKEMARFLKNTKLYMVAKLRNCEVR